MSFGDQLSTKVNGARSSSFFPKTLEEKMRLAVEIDDTTNGVAAPFQTKFCPTDMRQLALVAHNHMKPAMKEFITTYSEILQKFRITGTQTTMRMCKTLWGEENPNIEYGLTCTSGPLGGDAQIAALMCVEDLGALIFFVDPLSAHPHQADIDSLNRLSNCGNIIVCSNPTSAMSMLHTFKSALEKGDRGMIPSFFETLESPAVEEYKHQQELALQAAVASVGPGQTYSKVGLDASVAVLSHDIKNHLEVEDESTDSNSIDYEDEAMDAVQELRSQRLSQDNKRRGSMLSGIKIPPKKKEKSARKMLVKQLKKSVRRLNSK